MIYPTLHFNYNSSGYAIIKIVDTDLPDKEASLFGMTLEDDQRTVALFMNYFPRSLLKLKSFTKKVGTKALTMVY